MTDEIKAKISEGLKRRYQMLANEKGN
jgi:hypothetical protein